MLVEFSLTLMIYMQMPSKIMHHASCQNPSCQARNPRDVHCVPRRMKTGDGGRRTSGWATSKVK